VSGEPARINLVVGDLPPALVTQLRALLCGLTFWDPALRLRELRPYLAAEGEAPEMLVASEREGKAKLEEIAAALFALGYGEMYGVQTLYAMKEASGGDAVMVEYDEVELTGPPTRVQVKIVPSPEVSGTTLNEEIAKIARRYPSSPELTVVVALNMRNERPLEGFVPPPEMCLRELYVLAPCEGIRRWRLVGDLQKERGGFAEFAYPGDEEQG